jgi:hypothetical protein
MANEQNERGSPDKGGRPPMFGERMVPLKARVPKDWKTLVQYIGDGELSEGVRRLITHYLETTDTTLDDALQERETDQ